MPLRLRTHAAVLVLFSGLSALHTWPLLKLARGHLLGAKEDVFMNVWHLWWMRQALWEAPQNPWFAPGLHHPIGAELYWHTLAPAKTAFGALLLGFLRAETAYNLLIFSTFVLAGYTGWLLCRYLLGRAGYQGLAAELAAIAGASVFTFSRYHFAHASAHLNLSAIEGIPLFIYFFLRYLDEGRRKLLWGVGLSALYVALCDYYYLFYVILFAALWLVADRWQRGSVLSLSTIDDRVVRRAASVAGVSAFAILPAVLPLLLHLFPAPLGSHHGDSDYFVDLAALFLPDPFSAWLPEIPGEWSRLVQAVVRHHMAGNNEEAGYFFGIAVPLLAVLAVFFKAPQARRWAGIGFAFLVLSFGTVLQVADDRKLPPLVFLAGAALLAVLWRRRPEGARRRWDIIALLLLCIAVGLAAPYTAFGKPLETEIPLPYVIFKSVVPLFGRGGMPVRFALMTTLTLAVLFAFATAHVARWLGGRQKWAGAASAAFFVLVPNLEYRNQPFDMVRVPELPVIFDEIERAPADIAVLTDHVMGQWEQIYHRHPVSFARQSRLPVREKSFQEDRLFRALHTYRGCFGPLPDEEREELRARIRADRYGYYVAHRWVPQCDRFVRALGGELAYRDNTFIVYRFPEVLGHTAK